MDARQSQELMEVKIEHLEGQYADQKSDIKELRNIVLVLAVAGVAAIGGLYVQVGDLAKDLINAEARLNGYLIDLKHEQAMMRKDVKSIEDKLDILIKQGKTDK